MYEIRHALRRFKPLIRWTAYRFSTSSSPLTTFEDIEAEGFLTLVRCCREFPDGEKRSAFKRYFKRSWYNRLKDMNRQRLRLKRLGIEVELEEAEAVPDIPDERSVFIERMWRRFEDISPLLSGDARRLLLMLLDPTEAIDYAYVDYLKQNQLGGTVAARKFRVRLVHIRKALGMSRREVRKVVREVKAVNLKLRGKDGEVE